MCSNYSSLADGKEFSVIKTLGQRFCNLYRNATRDFKSLSEDITTLLYMIDELGESKNNQERYLPETFAIIMRLVLSCEFPMADFEEMQVQQEMNYPFVGYDDGEPFMKGTNGRLYTCIFTACISQGLDGFPYFWDLALHLRQKHDLSLIDTIEASTVSQLEEEWRDRTIANGIAWREIRRQRQYQTILSHGLSSPRQEPSLTLLKISLRGKQRRVELSAVLDFKVLLIKLCSVVGIKYVHFLFYRRQSSN